MQNITDTLILQDGNPATPRLAQYELLREAGRGGMSVVYEALDRRDQRTVALKVLTIPQGLTRDQEEAMLGRFARESRAVAGLSHPNIVAIYELGEEAGRHFLVMEYLRGESLRERLGRGPLTPTQALPILSQIADALDAVHARGVVHRDIKPSNVMLLPDGTAKLLDFGVSRQSDDTTITGTGALVGSPAYLSPEQVRGAEGTRASDIWALGALLYEMLAGHPPFTGKSIPAVLYQVTHEAPPPVVGVPTRVQRVLRRALDKNPARRYPDAHALAEALRAAVSEHPQAAAVPRRRPLPWHWAALLLPVLLGVAVVGLTRHPTRAPIPVPLLPVTAPVSMSAPFSSASPAVPMTVPHRLYRLRPHRVNHFQAVHKHPMAHKRILTKPRKVDPDTPPRFLRREWNRRRSRSVPRLYYYYHPVARSKSGDDPKAMSNLEHFIYSPGPP